MPLLQAMSERANAVLGRESIRDLDVGVVGPDQDLAQTADALGIAVTAQERDYLSSWPDSLQRSIVATVRSAITRSVPVTMSWAPGEDYELRTWEAHGVGKSPGGITLLLRSPYPVLRASRKRSRKAS